MMAKRNLKMSDIKPAKGAKATGKVRGYKVQKFSDYQPESDHKRLDQMIDQTIYIIKIEPLASEEYGSGFKLWVKDMPNAKDTYTVACFGAYVVPVLDNLYNLSHKGKLINPENPVQTTIRKAGRTYRFE